MLLYVFLQEEEEELPGSIEEEAKEVERIEVLLEEEEERGLTERLEEVELSLGCWMRRETVERGGRDLVEVELWKGR